MRRALRSAGFVVASFLTISPGAEAQQLEQRAPATRVQQSSQRRDDQSSSQATKRSADFLFGRPKGALGVRGNWVFATAGSDIFDFITRHLTLDKSDFNAPGFAADVSIGLGTRTDIQGGVEITRLSRSSEYRDFVDNRNNPIEQTTSLSTTQLVASLRYALKPKGEEISRLAWIPGRVVPYVGAGGGVVFYQFRQIGDFVDFEDFGVFPETFQSRGWTPSGHVFAGVDVKLYRALYAALQGRYTMAKASLSSDFVDFDPIDLSGFRMSAGVNVLF